MTTNQIKQLFNNNTSHNEEIELSDIVELAQKVKIENKIDKDKLNYYYSIDVLDLAKSKIEDDAIYNMVNKGWTLSQDKLKIVKFC